MKKGLIYSAAKQLSLNWGKLLCHFTRGLRNRHRSTADVFAEVYRTGQWGGQGEFYSGQGSVDDGIVAPYLFAVRNEVERLGMSGKRFVDLGCGDFRVGSRVASLAGSYLGVDIVPALIKHLNEEYGGGAHLLPLHQYDRRSAAGG